MHPNCKCEIATGSDNFLEDEKQNILKDVLISEDKDKDTQETLPNRKAFINMLKETLPVEDLSFFYNPTETYISKDERRNDLQNVPDYIEELYERYADKLIVEQLFEDALLSDKVVKKIDFLLNYDKYKKLPVIEDRLAIYDILESHGEMSKVNFQHYEDKLSNKDKAWIIATYNTTQLGTTVGGIFTGLILEGLSGVTSYFTAKNSGALNSLQKVDEADKYFKEEFLQGSQYAKEIKEFYVNNSKALGLSNEAELLSKTSKSAKDSSRKLNIDDGQFGKKIGKHAQDYGLDPADPNVRNILRNTINDIYGNATEVRQGEWMGMGKKIPNSSNAPG